MEKTQYILQEYNSNKLPRWLCLDGTVRDTYEEATKVLKEFEEGNGYSYSGGTGQFRIERLR
jgi:hypothetical protein